MPDLSSAPNLNLLFGTMVATAASGEASVSLGNSQSFKAVIAEAVKRVEAGESLPFSASGKGLPREILARLDEQLQGEFAEGWTEELLSAGGQETDQQTPELALLTLLKDALESGEWLPPDGKSLPSDGHALSLPHGIIGVIEKNPAGVDGKLSSSVSHKLTAGSLEHSFRGETAALSPDGDTPGARSVLNDRAVFQQLLGQSAGKSEPSPADVGLAVADKLLPSSPASQTGPQPSAPSVNLMQQNLPPTAGEHRPSLRLDVPMGQPGWDAEMAGRVRWLVQNNVGSAEIRLNPPELGPVEVRIKTDGDQTSVFFTAHHSATRDALEQALPRLREAFASSGLQLADANVADGQQQNRFSAQATPLFGGNDAGEAEPSVGVVQIAGSGTGLIDFYI